MSSGNGVIHEVFKDKALNDQLNKNGFVIVDFLDPQEVRSLTSFFYDEEEAKRDSFTTFASDDFSYRQKIDQQIKHTFSRRFDELFSHYKPFWGNFFIKKPQAPAMPLHADLQYVKEPENISLNIWCPLVDTAAANGTLGLIPYSHRLVKPVRGTNVTDGYRRHAKEIEQAFGKLFEFKAGQAVIYDHRVLHYSPANNSDSLRLAATLVAVPDSAQLIHYYAEQEGSTTIDKYLIDSADDFLKTGFLQRPAHLKPAETILDHVFTPLTVIDFEKVTDTPTLPGLPDVISTWRKEQPGHRLIKDQTLNEKFIEQGYLKLEGAIDPEAIKKLRALYSEHFTTPDKMFVTHHDVTDPIANEAMSDHIFELLKDFYRNTFADYLPLLSHFAAKGKGNNTQFNLHQDWSIVDEELYGVMHCWIPLQDVDQSNGTLAVLPASHLLFHNYRSGSCPIRFTSIDSYPDGITHISARAGDVVMYHPALFHGSGANHTDTERLAVVAAIAHRDAQHVYFHQQDNVVSKYELTDGDLFGRLDHLAKGGMPEGKLKGVVPYRVLSISDVEIIAQLNQYLSKAKNTAHAEV